MLNIPEKICTPEIICIKVLGAFEDWDLFQLDLSVFTQTQELAQQ